MLAQACTSTSIYTDWPTLLNYVQVWLTPAVCPSTYLQTCVHLCPRHQVVQVRFCPSKHAAILSLLGLVSTKITDPLSCFIGMDKSLYTAFCALTSLCVRKLKRVLIWPLF